MIQKGPMIEPYGHEEKEEPSEGAEKQEATKWEENQRTYEYNARKEGRSQTFKWC